MAEKLYDILIIGAGPAGMTAAIYAGRAGKSIAIFDKNGYGGNIASSPKVENIPGFVSVSGMDFANNMYAQMTNISNIDHFINEVALVRYNNGLYNIFTDESEMFVGKTIIFATGSEHRKLDLPTKNIYYCVTCDGPLFRDKNVVVVGSGNTGVTYALELASYCKQVFLCDVTENMMCEKILRDRVASTKNIIWSSKTTIKNVHNNKSNKLDKVIFSNGKEFKCSGIFAAIGLKLNTEIMKDFVTIEKTGEASTANFPGIFIAGDCKVNRIRQVVSACSDGAIAATNAVAYLSKI